MSTTALNGAYSPIAMVQNGATAQNNDALSHLTPSDPNTSAMVHVGPASAPSADEQIATADPDGTSDLGPDGADGVDVMHLSPKMHQALELLFAGHSVSATARSER